MILTFIDVFVQSVVIDYVSEVYVVIVTKCHLWPTRLKIRNLT